MGLFTWVKRGGPRPKPTEPKLAQRREYQPTVLSEEELNNLLNLRNPNAVPMHPGSDIEPLTQAELAGIIEAQKQHDRDRPRDRHGFPLPADHLWPFVAAKREAQLLVFGMTDQPAPPWITTDGQRRGRALAYITAAQLELDQCQVDRGDAAIECRLLGSSLAAIVEQDERA